MMKTRRGSIINIVGALPPTIGGVSIHVERLAGMLDAAGYQIRVYDIYSRNAAPPQPFEVRRVRGLWFALTAFWDLWRCRPVVMHWHVSQGTHLWLLYFFLVASPGDVNQVLTLHSGSFVDEMTRAAPWRRAVCRWVVRRAVRLVCVNPVIERYLREECGVAPERTTVIIPFIAPPIAPPQCPMPAPGAPRTAIVSGYAVPLYDWMTLVEGCQQACDCFKEVRLVFYNQPDPGYRAAVLARAAETPGLFRVIEDLAPVEFARLLAGSDLFIRPTLTDGDSIALREALHRGIVCIASDAVPRPEGCHLFKVGEAGDLARVVRAVCAASPIQPPGGSDGAASILTVYRSVIDRGANPLSGRG